MKNFKVIFCLLVLFIGVPFTMAAASVKDSVCIVKGSLSEKDKAFLEQYKSTLAKQGYTSYANSIEKFLTSSFGSGFVYTASNGKNYVITNRHVVANASAAIVQFEDSEGKLHEYTDLKIIAVDEDLDLAVIELPSSIKKSGLTFKTTRPSDGSDVWTAGFPGLAGEPVWQFGKGSVTNSAARIKELIDPEVTTLIQHSAQIDAGNSGGPLLVADSKSATGYAVVGINTWKALKRENTNFAVPASVIKTFVDKAVASKNVAGTIDNRLKELKSAVSNNDETYSHMARFISNELITSCTSDTFVSIVNKASSADRELIAYSFVSNPLEGIRYAFAHYIWNFFRTKDASKPYETLEPEKTENGYSVKFVFEGGNEISSEWIIEQGKWKIADFNEIIATEGKSVGVSSFSVTDPYFLNISGSYNLDSPGFDFTVQINSTLTYYEFGLLNNEDTAFEYGIGLHIPLNFSFMIIEPYAGLFLGMFGIGSNHFAMSFGYGYKFGADIAFTSLSDSFAPYIGIKYSITNPSFQSDYLSESDSIKAFSITAGLKIGGRTMKLW